MNCALVNSNFQLDVGSFKLRFQFEYRISNEFSTFPVNLQNSTLLSLSVVNDEWSTKKGNLGLMLKIGLTGVYSLTEILFEIGILT